MKFYVLFHYCISGSSAIVGFKQYMNFMYLQMLETGYVPVWAYSTYPSFCVVLAVSSCPCSFPELATRMCPPPCLAGYCVKFLLCHHKELLCVLHAPLTCLSILVFISSTTVQSSEEQPTACRFLDIQFLLSFWLFQFFQL